MRLFVLIPLLVLAGCAGDSADLAEASLQTLAGEPETRFMEAIESTIELPAGAYDLDQYTRTYMFGERKIFAIYTSSGQPGRKWVSRPADFPFVYDGGCSVVNVVYDLETRSFLRVACNGNA